MAPVPSHLTDLPEPLTDEEARIVTRLIVAAAVLILLGNIGLAFLLWAKL